MRLVTGAVIGERYELLGRIAVGGMGEVWHGRDAVLGRDVAVKLLKDEYVVDPGFRRRFRTEARNAAALQNPHIAAIYDYAESGDPEIAYLVMELVPGEPLSAILARGPVTVEQALELARQAALGLGAAHDAGVVHRDVKPGNLLVTPDHMVKITDFGIARAADQVPLTKTGQVMGTAQYLAPEQALGRQVTPASDVYGLGVVLYEMLTGSRPFEGDTPVRQAMAHVNDPPPPLPRELPEPVHALVDAALAKAASRRPADGNEFADAVADVQEGRMPRFGVAAGLPSPEEDLAAVAEEGDLATHVMAAGASEPETTLSPHGAPAPVPPHPDDRADLHPPRRRPLPQPVEEQPRRFGTGAIVALAVLAAVVLVAAVMAVTQMVDDSGTTIADPTLAATPTTAPTTAPSVTSSAPTTSAPTTSSPSATSTPVATGGSAPQTTTAPPATSAPPPVTSAAPPTTTTTTTTTDPPEPVVVVAADYIGRSLADVRAALGGLGLVVNAVGDASSEEEPDTVIGVAGGTYEVGDTVRVTYSNPDPEDDGPPGLRATQRNR